MKHFRYNGYVYIWGNLAFVALSLPLVTMPAAFSALMRVGHLAHTDPSEANLAAFWGAFKANVFRALPWGVANALFALVNVNNIIAYAPLRSPLVLALESLWMVAGEIGLGVFFFTWPMYYEMEQPTVWGATRNALVMVLQNPLFTLVILGSLALLALLSTVLVAAWLLLTFGAFAAIANAAVLDRLGQYRAARRSPERERTSPQP